MVKGRERGFRSRPTASRGTPRSSHRRSCRRGRPTFAARRRRRWRACTWPGLGAAPQVRPNDSSSTSRCTCCPRRKHRPESRLGKTGVNVCLDMLAALTDRCNSRLHRLACVKGAYGLRYATFFEGKGCHAVGFVNLWLARLDGLVPGGVVRCLV